MSRNYESFLEGYLEYAGNMESPKQFHLWTALSCISGALRGKCYIDMGYFKWKPNQFIIFIAPPGVVAKSTTSGVGMSLLRKVPGINFGPTSATWQALTSKFCECQETFRIGSKDTKMSCLTLECSELGTFLNFKDTEMIDVLVDMWDGKDTPFVRRTKGEGEEEIAAPWVNLIGCTTPSWIREHMPEYAIGGGFTSRCVFVYGDEKERFIAYPKDHMGEDDIVKKRKLTEDLKEMAKIQGEFRLSKKAKEYGTSWYEDFHTGKRKRPSDDRLQGYIARKQTHMHKVAMCLSAAERDDKIITTEHLQKSLGLLDVVEENMHLVFNSISDDPHSKNMHTIKTVLLQEAGPIKKTELYRRVCSRMPLMTYDNSIQAAIQAGMVREVKRSEGCFLEPIMKNLINKPNKADTPEATLAREAFGL